MTSIPETEDRFVKIILALQGAAKLTKQMPKFSGQKSIVNIEDEELRWKRVLADSGEVTLYNTFVEQYLTGKSSNPERVALAEKFIELLQKEGIELGKIEMGTELVEGYNIISNIENREAEKALGEMLVFFRTRAADVPLEIIRSEEDKYRNALGGDNWQEELKKAISDSIVGNDFGHAYSMANDYDRRLFEVGLKNLLGKQGYER